MALGATGPSGQPPVAASRLRRLMPALVLVLVLAVAAAVLLFPTGNMPKDTEPRHVVELHARKIRPPPIEQTNLPTAAASRHGAQGSSLASLPTSSASSSSSSSSSLAASSTASPTSSASVSSHTADSYVRVSPENGSLAGFFTGPEWTTQLNTIAAAEACDHNTPPLLPGVSLRHKPRDVFLNTGVCPHASQVDAGTCLIDTGSKPMLACLPSFVVIGMLRV